eukprot:464440-Ditylum_brightwellii.AAC.1
MKKQSGVAIPGMAKYVHTVLPPLDMEVISSFKDVMFISYLCANYVTLYIRYQSCGAGGWLQGS